MKNKIGRNYLWYRYNEDPEIYKTYFIIDVDLPDHYWVIVGNSLYTFRADGCVGDKEL